MLPFFATVGCGRLNFDPRQDASADGPTARCEATASFTTVRPVAELNGSSADGGLRMRDDELEAFFHSNRGGSYDLWRATRTSRELPFDPPISMLSGGLQSYWPTLSSNALTLVFNESVTNNLYTSTRNTTDEMFPAGVGLAGLNTAAQELSPAFGRTGTTLYFARRPPDSLFVAPWPSDGTAQPVTSLDSSMFEQGATLSPDDRVIYFGREATGAGMEIVVATRLDAQAAFTTPTPVAGLNTTADDTPTWLSPDLCRLYFESARAGDFDLYVAERTP